MAPVITPAADRAGIERLAHLPMAGRRNSALGPEKFKARRFPGQSEEGNESPALAFKITDQSFVLHFMPAERQHATPVRDQPTDFLSAPAAIGKVVREWVQAFGE